MIIYIINILQLAMLLYGSTNPLIIWNEGDKLSYDDFKASPPIFIDNKEGAVATTTVLIMDIYYNSEDSLVVNICAVFDSRQSWIMEKNKNNIVLNHEQRHFDITEYYARIIRSKIKTLTGSSQLLQEIMQKCEVTQDLYDKETEHGNNLVSQEYWDKKIDSLLYSINDCRYTEISLVP